MSASNSVQRESIDRLSLLSFFVVVTLGCEREDEEASARHDAEKRKKSVHVFPFSYRHYYQPPSRVNQRPKMSREKPMRMEVKPYATAAIV